MAFDINKTLKNLESRIEKLEQAVLGKRQRKSSKADASNFKGATGGLRLLATKGFFDRKRTFGEINEALASHGYHYSKQAVQTPLNTLSKPGSLLVSFREGGRKVYAKRK
jgi:hypothetical protein